MQKIGGPLHAAQKQRLMQAESQRIQKTAQDQEVGLKEPVAPRTRRAKDGMGGTARRARSFPALFPKNLCPVDEALEQRRGAIKIDGDVQAEGRLSACSIRRNRSATSSPSKTQCPGCAEQ